ncbi:MAG: histidine ammonia-lyase, partial [Thermodesulfobacteriota bacterium]
QILAMELLCSTQGLEFLLPLKPGIGIKAAYEAIRRKVSAIKGDRRFSEDIKKIDRMIKSGELLHKVQRVVGKLE